MPFLPRFFLSSPPFVISTAGDILNAICSGHAFTPMPAPAQCAPPCLFCIFDWNKSFPNPRPMTKEQYDRSIQTGELQLPGFWAKATHV